MENYYVGPENTDHPKSAYSWVVEKDGDLNHSLNWTSSISIFSRWCRFVTPMVWFCIVFNCKGESTQ